jgi:hypothetical protein
MKIAIMQPYFLPYIGYFQAIEAVDKYILYSNLNFTKKGWINRNRLLIKNQSVFTITVPIKDRSQNKLISSIKIIANSEWIEKLLRTIYINYKGAEHFNEVYPFLENMFSKSFEYLSQLNGYLITNICNYIGIKTTIESDSTNKYLELERKLPRIDENDYSHFRYMEKTRPEKKVARILEICKTENATTYINAIGGQNLYSNEEFSKYGIDLKFIQTEEFEYPQFSQDFQPNLSIVDVLMHNGSVGTKKLLQKHTLI